ncbi:MAG: imidazole glycerol phosphate synthase subunit HisH [Methanosphaera sp.]|nr:imidazole glycerol phosphate synthase subunit HisH [Methanosphaera sp.]
MIPELLLVTGNSFFLFFSNSFFLGCVIISGIVIVDYGSGNIRSIFNAFRRIGVDVVVSSDKDVLSDADALVIPGVGAYGVAMDNISGFVDVIRSHVDEGKPLLGICLGLQLLFDSSEETPGVDGLGIFGGTVKRFVLDSSFKIPQMGWNRISVVDSSVNNVSILDGVDGEFMYFVHSYYISPDDVGVVTAFCDYGFDVPVAVGVGNTFALQFHPEKSGRAGLRILRNFVDILD